MIRRLAGHPYAPPLALLLLALLVRFYRLDAQSLWLDEGSSWQLARASWASLLGELLNPTAGYPLYHLLLKLWIAIFGDSELALRAPSALAGALAVPAVYMAGRELGRDARAAGYAMSAALIVLIGPFPLWYAQEAKVYSLLLLAAALICWLLLRALRTNSRRDWLLLGGLALAALFVHRLAGLLLLGAGWAWLLTGGARLGAGRRAGAGLALLAASAGLVAAMAYGLGGDRAATGAYIPAGPLGALGLTFVRFSLDRWPGDAPWWWLAPWVALFGWGVLRLASRARRAGPRALLCLLGVPLALFLAQLLFTRLYEARYLMAIYPAWALALAYPLLGRAGTGGQGDKETRGQGDERLRRSRVFAPFAPFAEHMRGWAAAGLLGLALATSGLSLLQPTFGLFSGAPVKEQYREAIAELAARVQPDDAVVIHPGYIRPLYDYYMRRFTADPAPAPLVFADFWQGATAYGQREWDIERRQKLAGFTRSFLLIAPEHAKTVDAPLPGDEYGLVGNFWRFTREQRAWPCGIWRYNGAHLLCQEAPEPYYTGAAAPQPATAVGAAFGGDLRLLGYTLKATTARGPGVYRAGGSLAISLFWDVARPPGQDLSFFLHLCQNCDAPPAASDDGPPLEGYLPTSSWLPGRPARDDRAIVLPQAMPPGRYTLLLGVYRPGDPTPAARLSVRGGESLGAGRLVLGSVEIVDGD
jgi:4-amino-4-deoxy-L-arabinose transferase-like glycosyltransferase